MTAAATAAATFRPAIAAALLLGLAATATADPAILDAETSVKKSKRLTVELEVAFTQPGAVEVEGTINGHAVRARKRVRRSGSRRVRFRFRARRKHLRNLDGPITFDLTANAVERDGGRAESEPVRVQVPVPVIVLGGLGNETGIGGGDVLSQQIAGFADYDPDGKHPRLVLHRYDSLSEPLTTLGRDLKDVARRLMRRSPFDRVDVVGYSMGGLVARSWMAFDGGGAKVRNCVMLATPNEGTPIAYLGVGLVDSPLLDTFLGDASDLADPFLDQLLDEDSKDALRNFFPTYTWLLGPLGIDLSNLAAPILGDPSSPLESLNSVPPAPGVTYHALAYTEAGSDLLGLDLGTLDEVDALPLLALLQDPNSGGSFDPAALFDGDGDGVVPARSVFMADEPAWRDSPDFLTRDLGTGTHVTLPSDPAVWAALREILLGAPPAP